MAGLGQSKPALQTSEGAHLTVLPEKMLEIYSAKNRRRREHKILNPCDEMIEKNIFVHFLCQIIQFSLNIWLILYFLSD